jgi:hypothetical protein
MIKFNPENKDTLTYGEALKPAMEVRDKEEAQPTPEEAIKAGMKMGEG